jgi:hypothetical protein
VFAFVIWEISGWNVFRHEWRRYDLRLRLMTMPEIAGDGMNAGDAVGNVEAY